MPASWDSVTSNPDYQALPPDQQEAARQQYFQQVVAPQVPQNDLPIAKQQFDSTTMPKPQSQADTSGGGALDALKASANRGLSAIGQSPVGQAVGQGINAAQDVMGNVAGMVTGKPYKEVGNSTEDLDALAKQGFSKTSWPQVLGAGEEALMNSPTGKLVQMATASPQGMVAAPAIGAANQAAESVGIPHQVSQAVEMALPFSATARNAGSSALDTIAKSPIATDETGMGLSPNKVPAPAYDPISTHSAISDAYGAAKTAATPYYNLMRDIGSGESADASKLKPALDSMIADIQNTPFHEAQSELPYLRQQSAKIGDDGLMPLNDMVKLKQNLNSNFNPKRFTQGADTPYVSVGKLVDDSLDDASERLPEFGEAKSLADKNWLNTVEKPFQDNPVLKKFWQPEDYYAKKSVDSGMLEELPDATQQRAATMLGNIKSPVQLNAVRRVLPQDLADTLSQAKVQDITQGGGASRAAALGKTLYYGATGRLPTALRNAADVINPNISDADKALIDAAKQPSPTLSTKYQKPYADLRASIQQQQNLADEMQPFGQVSPRPKPLLALPAPEKVNYVNTAGQNTPLTAADRAVIGQSPSTAAEQAPSKAAAASGAELPSYYKNPGIPVVPPAEVAAARQAGMSPSGYAAMRQQELAAETANKEAIRKAFEEDSAWKQNKSINEAQRQQAVNNVYDQTQSPEWKNLAPQVKAKAIKTVIQNEIQRQKIAPENETEMGLQMRNAFGMKKGGRVNTHPTEAQKAAGNYAKHHIRLHGMEIAIENPKDSYRSGKDKNGKVWRVKLPAHYGYIKGTLGNDGDHVDCYIGSKPESEKVWIIDQKHADSGKFDECKSFIGFPNKALVLATYRKAFSDGRADERMGNVTEYSIDEFKRWLQFHSKQSKKIA